jgi:hypothetical protein
LYFNIVNLVFNVKKMQVGNTYDFRLSSDVVFISPRRMVNPVLYPLVYMARHNRTAIGDLLYGLTVSALLSGLEVKQRWAMEVIIPPWLGAVSPWMDDWCKQCKPHVN